jgi:hypothetical protein
VGPPPRGTELRLGDAIFASSSVITDEDKEATAEEDKEKMERKVKS